MDSEVIFISAGVACLCSIASASAFLAYKGKGGSLLKLEKSPAAGPGKPMPIPQMKKGGPWNIFAIGNPQNISSTGQAIKVTYLPNKHGNESGGSFKASPPGLPSKTATLSYSLYIPESFGWSKQEVETPGGKFPGLCFGTSQTDCATGGDWSTHAGSFRAVWREDGQLIGYLYAPLKGASKGTLDAQGGGFKNIADTTRDMGIHLWNKNTGDGGALQLRRGWNSVSLSVDLGTPGKSDGMLSLTCNGKTKKLTRVKLRESGEVKVSSVDFVTFVGGGSDDYNLKRPTYSLFKDLKFAAG